MLYFAYGSNLNHHQMKKDRCPRSRYIKNFNLKDYTLSFGNRNRLVKFGHANIIKKKKSFVPGAIWHISINNEKVLDVYEGFPYNYQKEYFIWKGKRVLFYIQKFFFLKKPSIRYLNTIIEGYKNCDIDLNYLKKKMSYYATNKKVKW